MEDFADFGFIDDQDFLTILSKTHNGDSAGKAFMQVLVTPLGMMKLAQKLEIAV